MTAHDATKMVQAVPPGASMSTDSEIIERFWKLPWVQVIKRESTRVPMFLAWAGEHCGSGDTLAAACREAIRKMEDGE